GPVATGPVPPKPAAPPAEETVDGTADGTAAVEKGAGKPSEDETRIVPKIIIVDDGSDYATPHTVSYNRR
ncbi:hypothetical protein, partial [Kitasatospora sp. MY 5-36]